MNVEGIIREAEDCNTLEVRLLACLIEQQQETNKLLALVIEKLDILTER